MYSIPSIVVQMLMLLFLLPLTVSGNNTSPINLDLGGRLVVLPAPSQFHEISKMPTKFMKIAKETTLPSNELLAEFVSESDLGRLMKDQMPELKRYFVVEVAKQVLKQNISAAQFADLKQSLKTAHEADYAKAKQKVSALASNVSKQISKEAGVDINMDMRIGEVVPLGVFYEDANSVSIALLQKLRITVAGENEDLLIAVAYTVAYINDKILYLSTVSHYSNHDDLEWVRTTAKQWHQAIMTANGANVSSKNVGLSAKLFSKSVEAAIGSVILVLVVGAYFGLKKYLIK